MTERILAVENLSKSYVGVRALQGVSISVDKGSVHCLVGENGSGKSTLIKTVAGVIPFDSGRISLNAKEYTHLRAIDSIREGIQVIYQDLSLFPNLTVAENISLNQLVEKKTKFIALKQIYSIAENELGRLKFDIDVTELVENLSMANKQMVAMARALTQDARLIIMDEPTSALTKKEIDNLFSVILDLKKNGISTLFVSHKLSEVLEISEKVSVLRDGRMVGEFDTNELDENKLVYHMTGKEILHSVYNYDSKMKGPQPLLEVRDLNKSPFYHNINMAVDRGEILGITGLLGSGRTELALSLFGLNCPDSGEVYVDGKLRTIRTPRDAVKNGIGYLPEDRHVQGLFLEQSVGDNIVASVLKQLESWPGIISQFKKTDLMEEYKDKLKIKTHSLKSVVSNLSGGNQQRVVIAKWLATRLKIFILDGPTVGIDIASKNEIHELIKVLSESGMGVIMISDEISEVFHNCNRIMVMRNGTITDEVDPRQTTEAELTDLVGKTTLSAAREDR